MLCCGFRNHRMTPKSTKMGNFPPKKAHSTAVPQNGLGAPYSTTCSTKWDRRLPNIFPPSGQIPPTKYIFVYNSLAYRNLYAKIAGDIPTNLQVKPTKHILGARLDQRLCQKGCSYGTLNFKPENTSTKVLDYSYIYQSLSGATLATYSRSDGEATVAKR